MAIYEISREKLERYLDKEIEKHPEYGEFKTELMEFFAGSSDNNMTEKDVQDKSLWQYMKGDPSQFYIPDTRYHIRIKDIVLDFFQNVFFGGLFEAVVAMAGGDVSAGVVTVTGQFIFFVKRIIKEYVVKLDGDEYAVYIEMISHFMEHKKVAVADVNEWIKREKSNPVYVSKRFLEIANEDIKSIMNGMVIKGVLVKQDDECYKINY